MTSVAIRESQAVAELPPLTLDDIKRYICPEATDAEAYMFLMMCRGQDLNPFLRDAYLVVYGRGENRKVSMIVGKDTFTKRADAQPELEYWKAGVIVLRNGEPVEIVGTFYLDTDKLVGGWCEVKRRDRSQPHKVTVRLAEYAKTSGQWPTMGGTMIRKVALVQGLREAFPSPFRGLYDAAEMGLDPETLPQSTVTVTSTAEPVPPPVEHPALEAPQPTKQRDPVETRRREMFAKAREAGWTNDDLKAHIRARFRAESTTDLSEMQLSEVVAHIASGKPPMTPEPVAAGQATLLGEDDPAGAPF